MTDPRARPVWIACPQHGRLVRGRYACEADGSVPTAPDGTLRLDRTRCDQDGGRCAETLCALHRFNRGGPATWYPGRVLLARDEAAPCDLKRRAAPCPKPEDGLA